MWDSFSEVKQDHFESAIKSDTLVSITFKHEETASGCSKSTPSATLKQHWGKIHFTSNLLIERGALQQPYYLD
jgi:hypothetical protein